MNTFLLTSGVLTAVGTVWHGVGGEMVIMRRIDERALQPSGFGDRNVTMRLLRGAWHAFTANLLVTTVALFALARAPHSDATEVLARAIAAMFGAYLVAYVAIMGTRPMLFVRVPQWILLSAIGASAWLGAAR